MTARAFVRVLRLDLPYDRGLDVLALQRRLAGKFPVTTDGIYGPNTAGAVKAWQAQEGLAATGTCDEATWRRLFPDAAEASGSRLDQFIGRLTQDHARFPGGAIWRLTPRGIAVDGHDPIGTGGEPATVRRIWSEFGPMIARWSTRLVVPAELIVATVAAESGGNPGALRLEPNYVSDEATPNKISPGLMQTLISTARATLNDPRIDRAWLLDPDNSIHAGAAYILEQSSRTGFDPPVVACSYNAGSVVLNESPNNRWRMRQYPIGTSQHCDRFVNWFNDCMAVFAALAEPPPVAFTTALNARVQQQAS